jgi:SagB-type dehydrogenase family enzyme
VGPVEVLPSAAAPRRPDGPRMTSDAVQLSYALAPDVRIEPGNGGAFLRTPISDTWLEGAFELDVLELLSGVGRSEAELHGRLRLNASDDDVETRCAALLFQLDRLGLLARTLSSGGRRLVSCVPLRPPPGATPDRPPEGALQLSPRALARFEGSLISLEAPGSWARMTIHDRDLLPLLHDLAVGRPASEVAAAAAGHSEQAILAVLALMSWCGLLGGPKDDGWYGHDLLFHARTRRGYARVLLGKISPGEETAARPDPGAPVEGKRHIALEAPDLARILAEDAPYALVAERRQSIRRQGFTPITSGQLSEFLFRTLHERGGRRPYPSGGACYPLKAYLAIHQCRGVAPGLYAYSSSRHDLCIVGESGPGLDELLADAAGAADIERLPQIVLVLAARFARTQRVYGALSYSLILKEVGAVFQAAMMAAAAIGLGTCPLGCGNSLQFSNLVGVDPLTETSVGEMIVGSLEESV